MTCAQSNSAPFDARTRHAAPLGARLLEADEEAEDGEGWAAKADAEEKDTDGSAADREETAADGLDDDDDDDDDGEGESADATAAEASSNTSVLRSATRPRGAASTKAAPVSTRVPLASTTACRAAATWAAGRCVDVREEEGMICDDDIGHQ
jgi:hypothetical protein